MALFRQRRGALIGERMTLPDRLLRAYPELSYARYRRGGLPPRIGGWCLGARTVAGITLGRTVWLAPDADLTPELLLHELAHVRQWRSVRWFAMRYLWECVRRGYVQNRYELEACRYACERLCSCDSRPA
jgi:hypothetical protein